MIRQPWDEYFINIAQHVSTRSTCNRKQVGCVIVRDKTVIATGYNGSLPHQPHCTDEGCYLVDNHCLRTVHAETNAINQAAKNGVSLDGASIYCTLEPCWYCFKNIITSGIKKIYYKQSYGSKNQLYLSYIANQGILFKEVKSGH